MKKVIIWDKDIVLRDTGGPSGYLYNLKQFLNKHPNPQISFYSDLVKPRKVVLQNKAPNSLKKRIKETYIGKLIAYLGWFYYQQDQLTKQDMDILNGFDYVHIHMISTYLRSFRNYKGRAKVIITSHMPEPCIDETMGLCGLPNLFKIISPLRNFFIRKELKAYEGAYGIMFPVKSAVEVYTENSELYKKCFQKLKQKMFYVPTAIIDKYILDKCSNVLGAKAIPEKNLKVCFIGRHNHVKGYDKLKGIAYECWKRYPDVTFIIGGKEEPLKGLKDDRWFELGWVNTQELLKEIDLFILPNKDTYFDLIMLEVIRQGVPCLISRTGGNKHFENIGVDGIMLYDYFNIEEAVDKIGTFRDFKARGYNSELRSQIREYYLRSFIPEVYINKYIEEIERI